MEEGDFRFIKNKKLRHQLETTFNAVTILSLWDYLAEWEFKRFVSDFTINKISWECEKNDTNFTEKEWENCLEIMCNIAKYGWEDFLTK